MTFGHVTKYYEPSGEASSDERQNAWTRIKGNLPRPRLFRFIVAWFSAWFLASWFSDVLLGVDQGYGFQPQVLLYFTLLSVFQFIVIRRFLLVELRVWIPLTIAGAVTGLIVFHMMIDAGMFFSSSRLEFIIFYLTLWSTPPLFQWLALRSRFRFHALWLLAALIIAPLSWHLYNGDNLGVFMQALPALASLVRSSQVFDLLAGALETADSAIPALILGLVLFAVVTQGGKSALSDLDTERT